MDTMNPDELYQIWEEAVMPTVSASGEVSGDEVVLRVEIESQESDEIDRFVAQVIRNIDAVYEEVQTAT